MAHDRAVRRPLSLTLRITGVVALVMTVVLVAFAWQVHRSLERHFVQQDLGELQAVADSLSKALASSDESGELETIRRRLAGAVMGHHGVYFAVWGPDEQLVYGTTPAELTVLARTPAAALRLDAAAVQEWAGAQHSYRGAVVRIADFRVLIAVLTDFHLQYLARLSRVLWLWTLVGCVVATAAAWFAVRWGHAPMRQLSSRIGSIGSGQLHHRLDALQVPEELQHLVESFNGMLVRLQDSFKRLSDFSADIAHELRTPVANLTTQAQVALSRARTVGDYQELLHSSLEELQRLSRMIGDMLFLAQADHSRSPLARTEVDLGGEVRELFDFFEALAEDRNVRLGLQGQVRPVLGDRSMLRRAISNLLSNGLRYTPAGQTLSVHLVQRPQAVEIRVENPGPAIAEEHLPRLFDRFYRIDPARQYKGDGSGLGLAIVKSIVEAHGGEVSVNCSGGKTCFSIVLPADAAGADSNR